MSLSTKCPAALLTFRYPGFTVYLLLFSILFERGSYSTISQTVKKFNQEPFGFWQDSGFYRNINDLSVRRLLQSNYTDEQSDEGRANQNDCDWWI